MVPHIVDGPRPFRLLIDTDNVGLRLLFGTKIAELASDASRRWQEVELLFLTVPPEQIAKVMRQGMP